MKKNKRKELTPADFGISFKGKSLKEFNDFFIKEIVSTSSKTFREYLPIYAAAFGFDGAALCGAFFRSSDTTERILLLVLPLFVAAVLLVSFFIKDSFIRTQTVSNAGVYSVGLMMQTFACAGIKGRWVLYVLLLLLTVISLAAGVRSWAKIRLRALAKSKGRTDPDLSLTKSITVLISVSAVPLIRGLSGSRGVLDVLMVVVSVISCALFGFIPGVGINNVRYYCAAIKKKH